MIGFYNYTVFLTYLSLLSASMGIFVSLNGQGHPYVGVFFLLFCGLCDAFDGKVARMKKDRSETEQKFGIQIDSLSDVVAFGVLPACIGVAMVRKSIYISNLKDLKNGTVISVITSAMFMVFALYVLSAMIRLAYFNVTEEERQQTEDGTLKYYTGVPVTTAALVFPAVLLIQYVTRLDLTLLYMVTEILMGFAFLSNFKIKKPGMKGVLVMVGIGVAEVLLLFLCKVLSRR